MVNASLAQHLAEPMGFMPSRRMRYRFLRELEQSKLGTQPGAASIVTAEEVGALPEPVRRCFGFAGVVGSPRVWSVRAHAMGRIRVAPTKPWMHCESWRFDTSTPVARLLLQRLRYGHIVPMLVRDQYVEGRGRLVGRVLDTFSVVDEDHEHVTLSELAAYVADAMLLAPSMLIGRATRWTAVDDDAFDVELHDQGWAVKARVLVDERGAVTEISTSDRYFDHGTTEPSAHARMSPPRPSTPSASSWIRTRWSTPATAWASAAGRRFARRVEAVWHLPSGDFQYGELLFDRVDFNVLAREERAANELWAL